MKTLFLLIILFTSLSLPQETDTEKTLKNISAAANGKVGAGIYMIGTGESAWLNKDARFPMQSVYKLPIGMAVLHAVDEGKLHLDDSVMVYRSEFISRNQHSPIRDMHPDADFKMTIEELLRYAVMESDGTASDVLMRLVGGAGEIMDYLKSIGVTGMRIADTEMEMGKDELVQYRNWSTPEAAVQLLKSLFEGNALKPETRQLMFKFLTETPHGSKRIKGLLPKNTEVAHKTGSSGTVNGMTAATNDIGIIRLPDGGHLIVAVFVSDTYEDQQTRENIIARIARFAYEKFSGDEKCGCF